MKKLSLALAIGVAAVALLAGLATAFPFAAIFLRVARESLMPQAIGWEAKNAWAKCDGAIGGTRQRSHLTSEQRTSLATAIRRLPGCGDP
jgi:hypothetical protein